MLLAKSLKRNYYIIKLTNIITLWKELISLRGNRSWTLRSYKGGEFSYKYGGYIYWMYASDKKLISHSNFGSITLIFV